MLTRAAVSHFWRPHWPFSILLSTVPVDLEQAAPPPHLLALQMETASNTLAMLPTCIQCMYFVFIL
jgi:hypothetical protein